MSLPIFQDPNKNLMLMQTTWKSQLDPQLSNPLNQMNLLTNVSLQIGVNTVNHKLGRKLQGWVVVGINGANTLYDQQSTNTTPQLTLILHSSAAVTVNLGVF